MAASRRFQPRANKAQTAASAHQTIGKLPGCRWNTNQVATRDQAAPKATGSSKYFPRVPKSVAPIVGGSARFSSASTAAGSAANAESDFRTLVLPQ